MIKRTIETERLIIRGFKESDLSDFNEYAKNPNVGPNAGWPAHKSLEESNKILHEYFMKEDNEDEVSAIVYKETGKVIGSIGLEADEVRTAPDSWVLGYVLSEDYWGRGLMTEAVKAVLEYVFEDKGAEIVNVAHFDFNIRSKRVIEKCGFKYEGTLRRFKKLFDGRIVNECFYSMLKSEYEELRNKLK